MNTWELRDIIAWLCVGLNVDVEVAVKWPVRELGMTGVEVPEEMWLSRDLWAIVIQPRQPRKSVTSG